MATTISIETLSSDPYPLIAQLREGQPVVWAPPLGRWLVARRDLILDVLADPERFTTDHDRSPIRSTFGAQMLSTDGAEQRRHRAPYAPAFRPRALRDHVAHSVHARAADIVAGLRRGDDLTEPASRMAVSTVLDMVGLADIATVETVATWYDALAAALANVTDDPDVAADGRRAAASFGAAMVEAARANGAVDDGLTSEERVSNTLLVLFGGIETTQAAILNALWALVVHPEAQAAVRADTALLVAAVEESLRWEPAVLTLTRFTTADVVLDGVTLPADSTVECLIAGANRDPAHFNDPDRFDVGRPNAGDHLTFGHGRHFCLGAFLARLEAQAFVSSLLERSDTLVFATEDPPPPTGHEFRKPRELRLAW